MQGEIMGFEKSTRKNIKIKIGLTGISGSGKTYSALRLARGLIGHEGKIAVLDTENGSASLYSDLTDFDVCEIGENRHYKVFEKSIMEAIDNNYDCIIIDSASHIWEGVLSEKEKLDQCGGNSFINWGKAGKQWNSIINLILQSNVHMICCFRSKADYIIEENSKGKMIPRKIGLAPIARDGIDYEFSIIFDINRNHEASVSKNRTPLFQEELFPITEKVGEEINEWLKTGKAFMTFDKIIKMVEDYGRDIEKYKKWVILTYGEIENISENALIKIYNKTKKMLDER